MVRPLPIEYEGALYHVMSRGIERRDIVADDRGGWLEWLVRTVETYDWQLHAFVLIENHHHLFPGTPRANLSAGMQYFNGSYTSYFISIDGTDEGASVSGSVQGAIAGRAGP